MPALPLFVGDLPALGLPAEWETVRLGWSAPCSEHDWTASVEYIGRDCVLTRCCGTCGIMQDAATSVVMARLERAATNLAEAAT